MKGEVSNEVPMQIVLERQANKMANLITPIKQHRTHIATVKLI